jgi:hypothetical protein
MIYFLGTTLRDGELKNFVRELDLASLEWLLGSSTTVRCELIAGDLVGIQVPHSGFSLSYQMFRYLLLVRWICICPTHSTTLLALLLLCFVLTTGIELILSGAPHPLDHAVAKGGHDIDYDDSVQDRSGGEGHGVG